MKIFEKTRQLALKKYWIPALLFILLFAFFFEWFRPFKVEGTVYLEIKRGDTLQTVVKALYERGITPSPSSFKLFYKIFGWKINAGDYYLKGYVNIVELADMFRKGFKKGIRVTIPEGFQYRQIAGLLADKGVIGSPEEMLGLYRDQALLEELKISGPTLEGYCYPDTYYFTPGEDPRDIIRFLNRQLHEKIARAELEKALRDSPWTLHEVLTLASIVEGEARLPKERPVEIDSPYNTYKIYGLPPGPINSPGIDSIRAVLYPAETDYLYFVSKNDGSHHFSRTYAEHLEAKRIY